MAQYTYERVKSGYTQLWAAMRVTKGTQAVRAAKLIQAGKERYIVVEKRTAVPWFVVGLLHYRESRCDFNTWLHNGDPMRNKAGQPVCTRQVPENRPVNPDCSWEDGAFDALITVQHFDQFKDWCIELVAYISEAFNGWGYRRPTINIPTPYLWGGTSVQEVGKFYQDHKFSKVDPKTGKPLWDQQLGVMAILKVLMELDPDARFKPIVVEQTIATDEDEDELPVAKETYKAHDGEAEDSPSLMGLVRKSTTMKGTLMAWFVSVSGWFSGFIDKLHDPVNLALFVLAILVACYAVWLAVSGRINAQKIIAHLADDNIG